MVAPRPAPSLIELEALKARLKRQGLDLALNHLAQAESALSRREWESANGQIRSCLEALFDSVVAIRLSTEKRGGDGRRELETNGVLGQREARLVQHFMGLAGEKGSHAGRSNEDEAIGHFLAGVGVAYLALSLIPELRRVEDVLGSHLKAPDGTRLPTDAEIRTSCPTCGAPQTLFEAEIKRDGSDTTYRCRNGCQIILVVCAAEGEIWDGRGYTLGDFVIRSAKDVYLPLVGGASEVRIPASPAGLMRRGEGK